MKENGSIDLTEILSKLEVYDSLGKDDSFYQALGLSQSQFTKVLDPVLRLMFNEIGKTIELGNTYVQQTKLWTSVLKYLVKSKSSDVEKFTIIHVVTQELDEIIRRAVAMHIHH